jgi:hypothetical protein
MAKESSDHMECEWKFIAPPSDELVLGHVRRLLPSGWLLVRWPPRTILDVYFDTDTGHLFADGASFRLRKRRINPGWSANFKERPLDGRPYHARREVITSVQVDEALQYRTGTIPGLAARLVHGYLHDLARNATDIVLAPNLHVVSRRRCYTMRPGDISDRDSNVLSVFLEEVTAVDIREVSIDPLITSGFLDFSRPLRTADFCSAEIEADGRAIADEDRALEMLVELADAMKAAGIREEGLNKYQQAAGRVDLWSARAH